MSESAELLMAIQALNAEFAHRIDRGEMETAADLFTEDGSYGRRGDPPSTGREAIRGAYRALNAMKKHTTRHVFTNFLVTPDGPDRARGICVLVMYAGAGDTPPVTPVLLQDCHDVYVKVDGRWMFKSREGVRLFADPGFTTKLPLGQSKSGSR
jgi:uncharacterized protein (TIGR02246 family)